MLCLFLSTTASVASSRAPPCSLGLPHIEDKLLQVVQTRRYVELARLLPQKRTKHEMSVTKIMVDDTKHEMSVTKIMVDDKGSSKPVADIASAAQWCQAFSIYAAYHSFYFPDLSPGLWSYMSFLTGRLGVYPIEMCLSYDIEFRKRLSLYPDTMRWEMPVRDIMDQTFRAPAGPVSMQATAPQSRSAFTVAQQQQQQHEICRKFQVNQCLTPCARGRIHVCFLCEKPGHTGYEHAAKQQLPAICRKFQVNQCLTPCTHGRIHVCSICEKPGHTGNEHTALQSCSASTVAQREVAQNLSNVVRPFATQQQQQPTAICRNFQVNQCLTPCTHGRIHVCSICEKPGHTCNEHTASQSRSASTVAQRGVGQNLLKVAQQQQQQQQLPTAVCRKFQVNQCLTPCRRGRIHVCFICEKPGHTGNEHYA